MSEGKISIKKAIPIIVLTWILSLVTTLAIAYFTPFLPIGTNQIGNSAVASENIASGAIITTKLADGSITNAKILDGTIIGEDIADGSIVTINVADGAVTATKIADNAVTGAKISDNAIVTAKLADGSVTSAKILDGTITAEDLATGAVTSIKIADGAITTSKLEDFAVTNQKLAPNAVPYAYTSQTIPTSTTSTTFVDMLDTSVTITLTRTSHVLIIFTLEFAVVPNTTNVIDLLAMVGTNTANPDSFGYQLVSPSTSYDTRTCTFYMPAVTAGTYTVKIRWHVVSSSIGYAAYRTLTVIGLPA